MYIIMGLPGAGKSTVISKFSERNKDWEIINYGTLMLEIAKKEFGVENRDEMRNDVELSKKVQREVARILSNKNEDKMILDTHASIKTPKGYYPGLPKETLEIIKVDGIILITAKAEEIINRREKDPTRIRDKEDIKDIEEHDLVNKSMCSVYSVLARAPFKIIENKEGKIEEAVEELEKILIKK